ncbi:MAG: hypothetical protein FWG56_08395 [Desulfovibrionaceae bacterium]|jgi:adenine-specific DNA-methyltransferase|nr:hypothetical protein [Desulfovibrionaceae bacterium]
MLKSLLEQHPVIVANGLKQAERILESRQRVRLQTREVVPSAKDSARPNWVAQQSRQTQHEAAEQSPGWMNRLIHGDNLLAMAALLAGDEHTPSLRGKVDLIYIDPPFYSKADCRTKVTPPGAELEQRATVVIKQFAHSDTWGNGTASCLSMMTPNSILLAPLPNKFHHSYKFYSNPNDTNRELK